jgi:hypothetical protein
MMWQHHPDCEYWFDQYPCDCCCGLTAPRPEWSKLEKWTMAQWDEWLGDVRRRQERAAE